MRQQRLQHLSLVDAAATVADAVAAIEIAALAPTIAAEATDLLVRNQLLRQAPHRLQSQ